MHQLPPISRNRLLAGLPPDAWASLQPQLQAVTLTSKQVLIRPGEPIDFVYFPESAMASIVTHLEDGAAVEVGVVGGEGMVGVAVALGADRASHTEIFVQIPDGALRMKADLLRPEMDRSPELRNRLFLYAQAMHAQVSQTAACNARHALPERLARWLLTARDAVGRDELPLTQEFLSMMLGVRRAGVTVAVGTLQQAGLITHAPGSVTIVNPSGLKAAGCECYDVVCREYDRLFS